MIHELIIAIASYLFIIIAAIYDFKIGTSIWRELVSASFFAIFQLIGIGFVLMFLLKLHVSWINLVFILFFFVNASIISMKRFKFKSYDRHKVFLIDFLVISIVTSLTISFFLISGVATLKATSIIPLAGILTSGGMKSLSLSFNILRKRISNLESVILGMAALGASDEIIFKFIFKGLINDVTLPARDMLKAVGIVQIPGIMVGLLMAGIFPLKAALVQFMVTSSMVFEFTFVPAIVLNLIVRLWGMKIEKIK